MKKNKIIYINEAKVTDKFNEILKNIVSERLYTLVFIFLSLNPIFKNIPEIKYLLFIMIGSSIVLNILSLLDTFEVIKIMASIEIIDIEFLKSLSKSIIILTSINIIMSIYLNQRSDLIIYNYYANSICIGFSFLISIVQIFLITRLSKEEYSDF